MALDDQTIRPLRKQYPDGRLYRRRQQVEEELASLLLLPNDQLLERAKVRSRSNQAYISSEALLHLLRIATPGGAHQDALVENLVERVERYPSSSSASPGETVSQANLMICDEVRDHIVNLLMDDRHGYAEALDYYEVNFNSGIALDRADAVAKVYRDLNRHEPLGADDDEGGISGDVEEAMGSFEMPFIDVLDMKSGRLRFAAAMDALPLLDQMIVQMWKSEIPVQSDKPDELCISKALGKSAKTIQTRLKKALAFIERRVKRDLS